MLAEQELAERQTFLWQGTCGPNELSDFPNVVPALHCVEPASDVVSAIGLKRGSRVGTLSRDKRGKRPAAEASIGGVTLEALELCSLGSGIGAVLPEGVQVLRIVERPREQICGFVWERSNAVPRVQLDDLGGGGGSRGDGGSR